jgi:hypothetical protein
MCSIEFWFFFQKWFATHIICVHTSTPGYASTTDISTTLTSPKSRFSDIGVCNSILEYASTARISIAMTMSFHVMPFEKRFLKKWFSPQISSPPPCPQEMEHWKKRKSGRKRKAPRVSSNKAEVNILRREKHLTSKIPFLMWFHFLPHHHTISKTLSKIIEKAFLAFFGQSFNLAIYITWVVPFLIVGWVPIFQGVRVSRLVEISTLMMKASNSVGSNPCSHYTTAQLVTSPCTHELALPRRLSPYKWIENTSKNRKEQSWIADEWLAHESWGPANRMSTKLFLTD